MKSDFMIHYQQVQKNITIERYKGLNKIAQKGQTLFCGSSLCEQFPINEMIQSLQLPYVIYNRGVGGFTIDEFSKHIDTLVLDLEPKKIFINIGSNDIGNHNFLSDVLLKKYEVLLSHVQNRLDKTEIFVLSYYPVSKKKKSFINEFEKKRMFSTRNNENITKMNRLLKTMCDENGYTYVNLYDSLADKDGNLRMEYTVEGVHLWPLGYLKTLEIMKKYF